MLIKNDKKNLLCLCFMTNVIKADETFRSFSSP